MLSIEDPLPDPLVISQLKSSDDVENEKIKASSDLLKSSLLDDDDNKNPLPKFSIRDYVFSARSKDITASWPFSEKNLQLCLKLGVEELLPPFQSFDSLRNQLKRRVVDYSSLDQENLSKTNAESSRQSSKGVPVSSGGDKCNQQLSLDRVHTISGRSDKEKEEEFLPTEAQALPLVDSGAETLLESSGKDVEAAVIPETRKTNATVQPPVKKCRLIVKLSNIAGSSGKDQDNNMHNSFVVSETTMASKVCPVCKNFSSSSNTTLNAHIDQCLSGESIVKSSADPKVIKHRIKPRKTRLMVDIYATAQYCTLEDLDRRNGTSWAVTSTLPAQETEVCVEERVQRVSTVDPEESSREGEVYIDTDGTKVRILSKISNALESKVGEHAHSKLLKSDKGSKFLMAKKKQPFVKKHNKFLKLVPRGGSCSPKPCPNIETRHGPERNFPMEHNREKEVRWGQRVNTQEQVKLDGFGITRKWVCSKNNDQVDSHDHSRSNNDLPSESDQSSLRPKNPRSCNNSISPQSNKGVKSSGLLCREQPNMRKGGEFSLLGTQGDHDCRKRPMISPKLKKLREESIFLHDKSHSNYSATRASSLGNKAVEINAAQTKMSDIYFVSPKPSGHHQKISSEATKFSSRRKKKFSSKSQVDILKSKSGFKRKPSTTRSQVRSRSDFAARPSHVDDDQQYDSMQEDYNNKQSDTEEFNNNLSRSSSRGGSRIRNNRGAVDFSRKEETAACLTSSLSEPLSYGHGVGENMEFSSVKFFVCSSEDTSDDEDSASREVFARTELVASKPSSKTAGRGNFVRSSSSSEQEFNDLDSPSAQCFTESINQGHLYGPEFPNNRSMGDNKQQMFSSDEDEHAMIGEDACIGTELDPKDVQAHYFSEVDPIPIPGPPGSFLPSPGHMESEELQGNSSLTTTCRVQSMDDQHDLVDGALPDSPISAISGISSPTFARSNSRSSEKLFVAPHAVQDDAAVQNFVSVSQATDFGVELLNLGAVRIDKVLPENVTPFTSKAEQSCCCSRKEAASLGVALDFQESQLLRRRTMASLVPLPGKQMDSYSSKRLNKNLHSRSEMFQVTNFPSSGSEMVVHHSMKLATGNFPMKVSNDPEVKFPIRDDHGLASPSSSNPVLRLMGKNLMVVNKDEDSSIQQCRQQQANSTNTHSNAQSCIVNSGFSHFSEVRNEDYANFHQAGPQSPVVFSHEQNNVAVGQHFDARLSNNFRNDVGFKTPKSSFHAAGVMFPSINASMEHYGNNGKNDHLQANAATSRPHKEIIIIDDAFENDSESVIDARCNMGIRRNLVPPSNASFPRNFEYNARLVNPLYCNQLDGGGCGSMYGVSPMMNNAAFQMSSNGGANAIPVKWSCNIPDGSSMRLQSPFGATTPSSCPGHVRPTFYYSPSFS